MKKKQTLKQEIHKTIRLLLATLTVLIVVLMCIFLFITSRNAELGYKLEQTRILNDQLKDVSQELKAQVTDVSTSTEVENSEKLKEMTPPDPTSTKYLLPKDNN